MQKILEELTVRYPQLIPVMDQIRKAGETVIREEKYWFAGMEGVVRMQITSLVN